MRYVDIIAEAVSDEFAHRERTEYADRIKRHYDNAEAVDLPPDVVVFLHGLHDAYKRAGGNMPLEMCVDHLSWQQAAPTTRVKNIHHPEFRYRAVFWPDKIDCTLEPSFKKWVMANQNVVHDLGWHLARDTFYGAQFEKIEAEPITPRRLWHITLAEFVPSILSKGLQPASEARDVRHNYGSPRIFFATNQRTVALVLRKFREIDAHHKRQRNYVVLAVNSRKVPGAVFRNDVQFDRRGAAVYTDRPIPPSAITIADEPQLRGATKA